jgi:hypothetical protein
MTAHPGQERAVVRLIVEMTLDVPRESPCCAFYPGVETAYGLQ